MASTMGMQGAAAQNATTVPHPSIASVDPSIHRDSVMTVLQDSIISQNKGQHSPSRIRFMLNLDNRESMIKDHELNIYGLRIGLQFGKHWRVGMGYYNIFTPLDIPFVYRRQRYQLEIYFKELTVFGEYVFLQNKHWEFSVAGHFGEGFARQSTKNRKDVILKTSETNAALLEGSISGHYKIWYWVGIGAGIGYRRMLNPDQLLKDNYDAPIYILKMKFFVSDIYRHWHQHWLQKKDDRKNPALADYIRSNGVD